MIKKKLILVLFLSIVVGGLIGVEEVGAYTLTLSTSGAQSIDVSTNGTGTAISADTVNVTTTCHDGYNLTLATSVNDNNLYLNGSTSNNTAGTYFAPSDGVTALSSARNTWGFYMPANGNDVPTANSVFNPVPMIGNPVTLKTPSQTASDGDINDTFSVYYGVSVSSSMTAGTYKMKKDGNNNDGSLVYYATLAEDCFKYTIHFDPTGSSTGMNITGTGTVADQRIIPGVTTNLTAEVFGNPTVGETPYYFTGWNTDRYGTGMSLSSGQSILDYPFVGSSITLYAQWTDCPPNRFCYRTSDNGLNVMGTMGQQEIAGTDTSAVLLASNFSRYQHGFAGWSDRLYRGSRETIYGPNETVEFDANAYQNAGRDFYAVWVYSVGNFQNWTCPNNDTMPIGTVTALTDQRDNDAYAVAKLADGNCWMIENLRLDFDASGNSNGSLAQGYGGQFAGLPIPESPWADDSTIFNSLYSTDGVNSTIAIGADNASYRFPRYNQVNTPTSLSARPQNPTTNTATNSASGAGMYSFGNYYTWAATVADTTNYTSNNQSVTASSICPRGWRLPRGGNKSRIENYDDNDFWNLIVDGLNNGVNPANYADTSRPYYNSAGEAGPILNKLRSFPNNFVLSGGIYGGTYTYRGSNGRYWLSTNNSYINGYSSYVSPTAIYPGTNINAKYYGWTVRCMQNSSGS